MSDKEKNQETRKGIIFIGRVDRSEVGKAVVELFIENQGEPVGFIKLHGFEAINADGSLVDKAFQKWVRQGYFGKSIKDPSLRKILKLCQKERRKGVKWYRLTFRFLATKDYSNRNLRFILTEDKSDLSDREKHIVKVGEEVVLQEEKKQEEARRLSQKKEQDRKERLYEEHLPAIVSLVKSAINKRIVPVERVRILFEKGLLNESTTFRSSTAFPGERWTLKYDFTEQNKRHVGFIGFDAKLKLISIDERLPELKPIHLGAAA